MFERCSVSKMAGASCDKVGSLTTTYFCETVTNYTAVLNCKLVTGQIALTVSIVTCCAGRCSMWDVYIRLPSNHLVMFLPTKETKNLVSK